MLDDRLIGMTFINTSEFNMGTIEQYGVYYHYVIDGPAQVGDTLEIVGATPLGLIVRRHESRLTY